MATHNLIQYFTTGSTGADIMNRVTIETFVPSGDFNAGDAVCFDADKVGSERVVFVKAKAADNSNLQYFAGIALQGSSVTGSDGRRACEVAVGGYVEGAKVNTGVSKGEYLVADAVVGQFSGSATWPSSPVFGVALEDDTTGKADVILWQKAF